MSAWTTPRELKGSHVNDFLMASSPFVLTQWDIKVDDNNDNLMYLKLHQTEFGSLEKEVVFEGLYSRISSDVPNRD